MSVTVMATTPLRSVSCSIAVLLPPPAEDDNEPEDDEPEDDDVSVSVSVAAVAVVHEEEPSRRRRLRVTVGLCSSPPTSSMVLTFSPVLEDVRSMRRQFSTSRTSMVSLSLSSYTTVTVSFRRSTTRPR